MMQESMCLLKWETESVQNITKVLGVTLQLYVVWICSIYKYYCKIT